jgi:protocatechuate 3,4-dioxygenase beta subunit
MTLTRREALGFIGAAGAASLAGFGGGRRAWAATCATTPAETEGPYFVDELLDRSDITVDPSDGSVQAGVPLRLELNLLRADDACAPAAGVQVDVWHANASGVYSDEAANGSVGKRFLRGYQVTDAAGAVAFTTVYPGWYSGRTIHIHFKVRVFASGQTTYAFTSQLYFDDAVNDQVMALSPYAARGARDTTNATDGIFGGGLTLTLSDDGSGGYVGRFDVALTGIPATTGGGTDATCATLADCRAALTAALPDPAAAADRKSLKVARRLARLDDRANALIDKAATAAGAKQARAYGKARALLGKLLAAAAAADGKGTLGVSLATLQAAAGAVVDLLPTA